MSLVPVLQHPAVEALGWSLLHFVWQGLAAAALLAVVLIPLRRASAHVRYRVECGALALMAACPLITWCWLSANSPVPVTPVPTSPASTAAIEMPRIPAVQMTAASSAEPMQGVQDPFAASDMPSQFEHADLPPTAAPSLSPGPVPSLTESLRSRIEASLSWLVGGWLLGVLCLSLRLLLGWRVIQRIKRLATSPAAEVWHTRCKHLAIRLGIRQSVKLVESALIEVPTVIGWMKPIILVPVSALAGLEPSQLEAILAHELAHIRRHDYIVNLIQTALETLLFYHPAVWWVSRLIRNEREHCCDDIAVEVCGNRVVYARALAEMESLRGSPRLTLAANDGSLLGRIRRLVCPAPEARNSVWWTASPMAIVIVGTLLAGIYASGPEEADHSAESTIPPSAKTNTKIEPADEVPDRDKPKDEADTNLAMRKALQAVIDREAATHKAIQTTHIRYRISSSGGPYKPETTPARCAELLNKYDLQKQPEDLRKLIADLYDSDEPIGDQPWAESEFYVDGTKVRESQLRKQGDSDIHITDDKLSLRWDAANSQVDIEAIRDNRRAQSSLHDFRQPLLAVKTSGDIKRQNGQFILTTPLTLRTNEPGFSMEMIVDEATGCLVKHSFLHRDLGVFEEKLWQDWKRGPDGIPFPKLVIHLRYQKGILSTSDIRIVDEAQFNLPLAASLFQLGAPAGSVLVDHRKGQPTPWVVRINHDVFDVTSDDQVTQAIRPLSREPTTPEEKFAVAELKQLYRLADDELIKRIGPPYPLSRQYIRWLLGKTSVPGRRPVRFDLIQWQNNEIRDSTSWEGLTPRLQNLIFHFLKFDSTIVEGDPAILRREIEGDFIYRPDAPIERLADRLAQIASEEFRTSLKLTIREVERPVYVVRGELKLNLPAGETRVDVNGGKHAGDFGELHRSGRLEYFLREVGGYVGTPVINETGQTNESVEWSQRWYDLATTKPERRFKLDPASVLKQITDQTGLTFTKETRMMRVLFVETDAAATPDAELKVNGPLPKAVPNVAAPEIVNSKTQLSSSIQSGDNSQPADQPAKSRCELAGHVLDKAGRLVKGATIHVWQAKGASRIDIIADRNPRIQSNEDGRFEIRDLPAGDVKVGATIDSGTGDKKWEVFSQHREVTLTPQQRAYCRCQLVYPLEQSGEKYLSSGGAYNSGTWSEFNFDPRSMQASGHRPPKSRPPLHWGEITHGLQVALVLSPGKSISSRAATLIFRNTLTDRMIDFHRYKDREKFVFEVIHPDSQVEVIERDLWPLNKLPPSHVWNGIFLRPGDEYELNLGEFEHPALTKPQEGVSVRASLTLFSNNEKVDAIRQEEFFPTSVMETGWLAFGQDPAAPTDKPVAAAPVPLARLVVVDQKTGKPLPKFAVIPGTESGLGNEGEPTGFAQWQPHLWREGLEGKFDWPAERSYPAFRLRIEADGYRPALTQLIRKADGPITLLMKMIPDAGLDGRIVAADGKPVAKAQVGVAMSARTINLVDRQIKLSEKVPDRAADKWRIPLVVETDADGRFHLPPEISPALVVIVHESGYAELRRHDLIAATSTITLRPWGRIEGQLLWGSDPGENETISMIQSRPTNDWIPLVSSSGKTKTDADGRFTFDHVPPGLVQISREQERTAPAEGNVTSGLYFPVVHVTVESKSPTSVVVGGEGQPLIGRLKGLEDWKDIALRIFPYAPRPGDPGAWQGYSQFAATPQGKLYHREKLPVQADGTFRIEKVPAATYQWQVMAPKGGIIGGGTVIVPAMPGGKSDKPTDLGTVAVRVLKPPAS